MLLPPPEHDAAAYELGAHVLLVILLQCMVLVALITGVVVLILTLKSRISWLHKGAGAPGRYENHEKDGNDIYDTGVVISCFRHGDVAKRRLFGTLRPVRGTYLR